jgi:hypothetical protein
MLAPIVLFVYCRVHHTAKVIESLLNNDEAKYSDLIIYSDAAKDTENTSEVQALRDYLRNISGFKSITIFERSANIGLYRSVIDGVTEVLSKNDRAIFLEDDIVVSPFFLHYMNSALVRYKDNSMVASIHGYVYPIEKVDALPETFFLLGSDCWGWATWRRAWNQLNEDGNDLYKRLAQKKLINKFDFNGSYKFSNMLLNRVKGKNNSWAILWCASTFLLGMVTLYPSESLVINIGNDGTGTHKNLSSNYDVKLSQKKISQYPESIEPSVAAYDAFERYFLKEKPSILVRLINKFIKIIKIK